MILEQPSGAYDRVAVQFEFDLFWGNGAPQADLTHEGKSIRSVVVF